MPERFFRVWEMDFAAAKLFFSTFLLRGISRSKVFVLATSLLYSSIKLSVFTTQIPILRL